jgi:hypothetical protein
VPADHKKAAHALIGGLLTHLIERLDQHYPELDADQAAALATAREALLAEGD